VESQPQNPVADRPCPLLFIVLPAFVGTLLWLVTLLNRVGP
jgi:hypothetical protein